MAAKAEKREIVLKRKKRETNSIEKSGTTRRDFGAKLESHYRLRQSRFRLDTRDRDQIA